MRIRTAWLAMKNRLTDTTGAITQEYVMNVIIAAGLVSVALKVIGSAFFTSIIEKLLGLLFQQAFIALGIAA